MRVAASALGVCVLAISLGVTTNASATVFLAKDEALALAFPGAERIEDRVFILTDAQKAAIEKQARTALESQLWRVHVGWKGSEMLGYAVLDTHVVRTLPETFMVVMAPGGTVKRVEILAFYEPPEYVPAARWKQQFEGRRLDDDLRLGGSIQGITGSTLSATATTQGVRRVLALVKVLIEHGLLPEK
jgi:hypothetical protein